MYVSSNCLKSPLVVSLLRIRVCKYVHATLDCLSLGSVAFIPTYSNYLASRHSGPHGPYACPNASIISAVTAVKEATDFAQCLASGCHRKAKGGQSNGRCSRVKTLRNCELASTNPFVRHVQGASDGIRLTVKTLHRTEIN